MILIKLNSLAICLSVTAAPNMSVMPAAAREGNGGSRDSSEFEFVGGGGGKVGLPPPNPLLLPSSPLLPSPQISPASSSAHQTPPTASTGHQPALVPPIQPMPMPAESTSHFHSLPQSMSLPSMVTAGAGGGDGEAQVKVATAGSPPSPGVFSWVKGGNFLSKVVKPK